MNETGNKMPTIVQKKHIEKILGHKSWDSLDEICALAVTRSHDHN